MTLEYRIGDVANLLGIPPETLRYYERVGLVEPLRSKGNDYRIYPTLDVHRLVAAKMYRGMGFSLEETASILHGGTAAEVSDHLRRRQAEVRAEAEAALRLERKLGRILEAFEAREDRARAFRLVELPVLYQFQNQSADGFSLDPEHQEATHRWMGLAPFVRPSFFIPINQIPGGSLFQWGYSVEQEFAAGSAVEDHRLTRIVPAQTYLSSVFELPGDEEIRPALFGEALFEARRRGLTLGAQMFGAIVFEENLPQGVRRFFEAWFPVFA